MNRRDAKCMCCAIMDRKLMIAWDGLDASVSSFTGRNHDDRPRTCHMECPWRGFMSDIILSYKAETRSGCEVGNDKDAFSTA